MPFPQLCIKKENKIYSYTGIPESQSNTMFLNAEVTGDKERKYLRFCLNKNNYILPTTSEDPDKAKFKFQYNSSKFGVYNSWGKMTTKEERKTSYISFDKDEKKRYITHYKNNSSYQEMNVSVKSQIKYLTTNTRWTKTYRAEGAEGEQILSSSCWTGYGPNETTSNFAHLTSAPLTLMTTVYEHISRYTTYFLKN